MCFTLVLYKLVYKTHQVDMGGKFIPILTEFQNATFDSRFNLCLQNRKQKDNFNT